MKHYAWLAAAALAVCSVSALAVACGSSGDDDDMGSTQSSTGAPPALRDLEFGAADGNGGKSVAGGAAESAPSSGGNSAATVSLDRKIVFSAAMSLRADDVAASFDAASRAARDAGGFVEKSSFSNESDEPARRSASLSLRVPVQQYEGVLAKLRGLPGVTVNSESAQSTEVTDQYTDLQSRLRNLERQETQYLELLAKATTIPDIITVTDKLDGVRLSIEQIQGRLTVLDDLTDLASIDVSLSPAAAGKPGGDGPKSFVEAFEDAWAGAIDVARALANAGAVVLVAAVWLAVPALVVFGAMRWSRRNRQAPAV